MIFKYCADEETFQNILNEFPERYAIGVSAPFLNLFADKDTVEEKEEKNKRHPSLLYMFGRNKICPKRNVDSWCEDSVIFVSFPFFFYHVLNDNTSHMVTCFIFSTFAFAGKVALGSANYFNNNNNNNTILVI